MSLAVADDNLFCSGVARTPMLGHGGRSRLKSIARKSLLAAFRAKERIREANGLLLTFDDGPDPDVTPAVLDLLAKFNARAVFFIVGNRIPRAPHLLERILAEGHAIGNHTNSHPLDHVPGLVAYYRDVMQCQAILTSHTGIAPMLFRPPLGAITIGSLMAPRLAGLRTVLWSIDVDDWKLRYDDDAVQAGLRLAEAARPGDIVLLHDDNPCIVALLEIALPRITNKRIDVHKALTELRSV